MRTFRWIVGLVSLAAAVIVVGSPASAAPLVTITGTAACDAAASSWNVTWTVTNASDWPLTVHDVTALPRAPIQTVTGIAVGDVVPVGGIQTAASVVHSYQPGFASIFVGFRTADGTQATTSRGQVHLPTVCGDPVLPTVDFVSGCDDLAVHLAMPVGGYTVQVEISTSTNLGPFTLEPGAPAKVVTLPPAPTVPVRVNLTGGGLIATGTWKDPGNCLPPSIGTTQFLASANYAYLNANFAPLVYAGTRLNDDPANYFELYDAGGGDIAIRSMSAGRFLTVTADVPRVEAIATRVFGDAQKFRMVDNADGTVSLRSTFNGKYVTAEAGGAQPLFANRTAIGPWEKFTRFAIGTGPMPILAQVNGRQVTAEKAGAQPLIANRSNVGLWEMFTVVDLGNGDVALKALVNGKYVCAESAGQKALIANRAAVGPWETFKVIHNADFTISFQAKVNGRYVTAEKAGALPLIANRTAIGPWEKFH